MESPKRELTAPTSLPQKVTITITIASLNNKQRLPPSHQSLPLEKDKKIRRIEFLLNC
jgi:hypothetical protein